MATHSVWSDNKPLLVIDGNTHARYNTFTKANAVVVWTENTSGAYCHALAQVTARRLYEFTLVAVGNSDADSITGLWDIKRNGTLVCNRFVGKAYGLSEPVGKYFKIYVGTSECYAEIWHFSAYITARYDY